MHPFKPRPVGVPIKWDPLLGMAVTEQVHADPGWVSGISWCSEELPSAVTALREICHGLLWEKG